MISQYEFNERMQSIKLGRKDLIVQRRKSKIVVQAIRYNGGGEEANSGTNRSLSLNQEESAIIERNSPNRLFENQQKTLRDNQTVVALDPTYEKYLKQFENLQQDLRKQQANVIKHFPLQSSDASPKMIK